MSSITSKTNVNNKLSGRIERIVICHQLNVIFVTAEDSSLELSERYANSIRTEITKVESMIPRLDCALIDISVI